MQDKFSALLPILGAIVAFLIAALLVLYIFRLLFGRGIRSGGKKGSRRLDVVDVFDLDRERQLVIVRRDNTEHLLLIGGPNDLLVEGDFSPSEALAAKPVKESRPTPAGAGWPVGPTPEPASAPASAPALPAASTPKPAAGGPLNLSPDLLASAPKQAPPEPAPAPPAAAAPPPPARPAAPAPARPTAPRAATPPFLARTQRVLQPKPDANPVPPPPAPRPAALPPAPPAAAAPPPPPPPGPPPAPPRPAAPPPPLVEADPLESLEAEMARLLGRPDKE